MVPPDARPGVVGAVFFGRFCGRFCHVFSPSELTAQLTADDSSPARPGQPPRRVTPAKFFSSGLDKAALCYMMQNIAPHGLETAMLAQPPPKRRRYLRLSPGFAVSAANWYNLRGKLAPPNTPLPARRAVHGSPGHAFRTNIVLKWRNQKPPFPARLGRIIKQPSTGDHQLCWA